MPGRKKELSPEKLHARINAWCWFLKPIFTGLGFTALCILLTAGLATGCKPKAPGQNTSADYFQTPFQTESQFIVETIVSDLAEQVFYAANHRLPDRKYFSVTVTEKAGSPVDTPVYELQIRLDPKKDDLKLEVSVNGPIWSPAVYQGVVKELAQTTGLKATERNGSENTVMLSRLTDSLGGTLEQENRDLSDSLEEDFTNSVLHEQAAVLLGAFTLREHSGDFYEIRSPLCRITAHLAMAQYLAGERQLGINGRVAEAMLLTLMNDQAPALEKLSRIETNDPVVLQWVRTLQADNSGDYRPLAQSEDRSAIERIAWFQAFARSVDADMAWSKLYKSEKVTVDFARIANEQEYSVETGHQLLAVSVPLELKELATVHKLSKRTNLTTNNLVAELNVLPERCFTLDDSGDLDVKVIGWGMWAMFFQRQLCHAMQHDFDFLQNKWGVPDEAKKFSANCDRTFGALHLYPFARRFNCIDKTSYHRAVDDGFRVTVAMPQYTPAECWNELCYYGPDKELYSPNPNPHINEWHKNNPPPGTAYNPLPRMDHPSLTQRPDAIARITAIHELAPYDRDISYNLLRMEYTEHNVKPTYEQCREIYKQVLPFATYAMAAVADTIQDQPDRYEELMARAAAPDPARYYNLGEYFQARHMDDRAAMYLEKGNDLCPDRVNAASYAPWLVRYYLKKGRTDKARQIADDAGEVYSSRGLEAEGLFFEMTSNYLEAFEWYAKIDERYDDSSPLLAFCFRYKAQTGDTRFESEAQKRIVKFFPNGIENVSLKDFQGPPRDGTLIEEDTDSLKVAGLKAGSVIVAVYGVRVHTAEQYYCARNFNNATELDLIVWQDGGYHEIKASPPDRRFGGNFGDYRPK